MIENKSRSWTVGNVEARKVASIVQAQRPLETASQAPRGGAELGMNRIGKYLWGYS